MARKSSMDCKNITPANAERILRSAHFWLTDVRDDRDNTSAKELLLDALLHLERVRSPKNA